MITMLIKVSSFVAIIVAGIIATHTGKLDEHAGSLISKIIFNLTLPAAIIHAFGAAEFTLSLLLLVVVGVACTVVPYLFVAFASRHSSYEDRKLYLLNCCGFNIGSFALAFLQEFSPFHQSYMFAYLM